MNKGGNSSSVAIITTAMNSADTLAEAIHSVSGQYINAEHIVIDGGSDDVTPSIIESHRDKLSKVVSEPDKGIYDALNKGISRSESKIVGILHADDLFADQSVIEHVLDAFADPDVDAVYGDLDYVDRQDTDRVVRRWRAGDYSSNKLFHGWMPPHPTFFVRREYYERFGMYRLDLGTAADYELMLRFLLIHGIRMKYIPSVLVKMRAGGASNVSLKARWNANRMDRKAWNVNGLRPYPWTLIAKPLRKAGQWVVR